MPPSPAVPVPHSSLKGTAPVSNHARRRRRRPFPRHRSVSDLIDGEHSCPVCELLDLVSIPHLVITVRDDRTPSENVERPGAQTPDLSDHEPETAGSDQ